MKLKTQCKGETIQTVMKVLKEKNGLPTKIEIYGHEYALLNPTFINGNRSKVKS